MRPIRIGKLWIVDEASYYRLPAKARVDKTHVRAYVCLVCNLQSRMFDSLMEYINLNEAIRESTCIRT